MSHIIVGVPDIGLGAFLIFGVVPRLCTTIAVDIKTTTSSFTLNYYYYFASHMCVGFPARGRVSFIKVCKSRGGAVGFNLGTKPAAERQRHPLLIHLSQTWESMNLYESRYVSTFAHFDYREHKEGWILEQLTGESFLAAV